MYDRVLYMFKSYFHTVYSHLSGLNDICDCPQENWPSLHLEMIVEIPVLKVLISITSFCLC